MEATAATFQCPGCGRQFRWKPQLAGRQVKCKCGSILTVPDQPVGGRQIPTAPPVARRSAAVAPAAAPPAPVAAALGDDDDPLSALAGAAAGTDQDHMPRRIRRDPTFAHTLRAHVDRFGRIDHDWPCGRCGVSVRGQLTTAPCPHCGAAIELTNPRELSALRKVTVGLALLGWGGLLFAVASGIILLTRAVVGVARQADASRDVMQVLGVIALILAILAGLCALAGFVVDVIGKCFSLAIPAAAQARGLMITALILEAGFIGVALIGAVLVRLLSAPFLAVVVALLTSVAMIGMFICVLSYLGKAARYTQCIRASRAAGTLIIATIVCVVILLIAATFDAVAQQQWEDYARHGGPAPARIGERPAMAVIAGIIKWLGNLLGLVVIIWYTAVAFGFRKRLKRLVVQCQTHHAA